MLSQIKSRGVKQPQYYVPIDKKIVDNAEYELDDLVRVEKVEEITEKEFSWFIGKSYSFLKNISIDDWYPLVDSTGDIENFITADFDTLWKKVKHFNRDDYDFDDSRECAIYKQGV